MSRSSGEPAEQLRLVHDELDRQRDATADKHRTMYQRATLVIGAATLVSGIQGARLGEAFRVAATSLEPSGSAFHAIVAIAAIVLGIAACGTALVAALCGIRAIRVERGEEIDIQKLAVNVLSGPRTPYAAEWSLVRDKIEVHRIDIDRLENRRRLYTGGAVLLVISWCLAIAQFIVSAFENGG